MKRFLRLWMLTFLALLAISYTLGFMQTGAKETLLGLVRSSDSQIPSPPPAPSESSEAGDWLAPRIVVPKLGVDSPIILSDSRELDALNADLKKGVVHYPDSAYPGQEGNMLLFGHSSALPVVHNPAYKVFSRLKELNSGDIVEIYSGSGKYTYVVTSIKIKQADDAKINLTGIGKLLTLSTCDVFGGEEARYVVTAEFLGKSL